MCGPVKCLPVEKSGVDRSRPRVQEMTLYANGSNVQVTLTIVPRRSGDSDSRGRRLRHLDARPRSRPTRSLRSAIAGTITGEGRA